MLLWLIIVLGLSWWGLNCGIVLKVSGFWCLFGVVGVLGCWMVMMRMMMVVMNSVMVIMISRFFMYIFLYCCVVVG